MSDPRNTSSSSPTTYAAGLIARGYTPDEVAEIMRREKIIFPTISSVLNEMMGAKGLNMEDVAGRADIDPATIYRFMSKKRNPSRNALIRIAMGMELSLEETQILLKSGNCAALSASRERDLEIMNGIIKKKYYIDVNEALKKKNLPDLDGRG